MSEGDETLLSPYPLLHWGGGEGEESSREWTWLALPGLLRGIFHDSKIFLIQAGGQFLGLKRNRGGWVFGETPNTARETRALPEEWRWTEFLRMAVFSGFKAGEEFLGLKRNRGGWVFGETRALPEEWRWTEFLRMAVFSRFKAGEEFLRLKRNRGGWVFGETPNTARETCALPKELRWTEFLRMAVFSRFKLAGSFKRSRETVSVIVSIMN